MDRAICIFGCGGIGSNVAIILAKLGLDNIHIFDFDHVEASNLFRTPFGVEHIGSKKIDAIVELMKERSPLDDPKFYGYDVSPLDYLEEMDDYVGTEALKSADHLAIFDCRDEQYNDYPQFVKRLMPDSVNIYRPAYDGFSITYDNNPLNRKVWGQRGYVVGSSIVSTMYVALIAVLDFLLRESGKEDKERLFTIENVYNMFDDTLVVEEAEVESVPIYDILAA